MATIQQVRPPTRRQLDQQERQTKADTLNLQQETNAAQRKKLAFQEAQLNSAQLKSIKQQQAARRQQIIDNLQIGKKGKVRTVVSPGTYVGPQRAKSPLPTKPPWNATRTVTVLWVMAFLLYAYDHGVFSTDATKPQAEQTHEFLARYAGWGIMGFILIAGTDFEVTRELSVAFAFVILLSVLIVAPSSADKNSSIGVHALTRLATFLDTSQQTKGTTKP